MLILETTRNDLLKPLQTIAGIIERRHTMPILSHVLVENHSGQVSFLGTDLEIQMRTTGPKTTFPDFTFTTNVRKFLDILRALPESSTVKLELSAKCVTLLAGCGRYQLQILSTKDFPVMKIEDELKIAFSLPQQVLHEILSLIQYAMAVQDIRMYLMGILLEIKDNHLNIVATDGHRLAFYTHKLKDAVPDITDIIIPRKTVLELYKLLTAAQNLVTVDILKDKVRFSTQNRTEMKPGANGEPDEYLPQNTVVVSKIIDSKFPDYRSVIPADNNHIIIINRLLLLGALERVAILANEKIRGVNLYLSAGKLTVKCSNNDSEEAEEELAIDYQDEDLALTFNIQYLLDVLRSVSADHLELAFGQNQKPGLFTIPNKPEFKYVVMPMQI